MTEKKNPGAEILFAHVAMKQGDCEFVQMFVGITPAAVDLMRTGVQKNLDLTTQGMPCKMLFFTCDTHADGMSMLATLGLPITDLRAKS